MGEKKIGEEAGIVAEKQPESTDFTPGKDAEKSKET